MSIKKKIAKFNQWPIQYPYDRGVINRCQCCGEEYAGNFCPAYGQRARAGRITWQSVRKDILNVGGVGSRSLPRTLWNLFLRPGHLIGDYISGKRQVSFPPVKMLIIVALLGYLIMLWMDPSTFQDEELDTFSTEMSTIEKFNYCFTAFFNKIQHYINWLSLLAFASIIYPTWVVFRYAPRNDHHTMPQGFFIQVFNGTFVLIAFLFVSYLSSFVEVGDYIQDEFYGDFWEELYHDLHNDFYPILFIMIIFFQLWRTYHQLFGYNWWSTTWRLIAVIVIGDILLTVILILSDCVVDAINDDWDMCLSNVDNVLIYILCFAIPLVGCHLINKITSKAGERGEGRGESKSS